MVSSFKWILCFIHPWVSHIKTNPFPEGTGDGVCGVDPAIGVENILWNVFGVYAVYWVADILFGRHNEGEGEHAGGGHAVVQSEHPAVDVNVGDMKESS